MGQYGNQPDFGTKASGVTPTGTPFTTAASLVDLKSAALYIGTGGTLICRVIGGGDGNGGSTVFTNVPDGTFFPVIVTNVYQDDDDGQVTTCGGIIALY